MRITGYRKQVVGPSRLQTLRRGATYLHYIKRYNCHACQLECIGLWPRYRMPSLWACDQCKAPYSLSKLLERHAIVTGHAAYRCSQTNCQKSFRARPSWLRHEKSHRSHKNHICSACSKSFQRRDNCKEHEFRCVRRAAVKLSHDLTFGFGIGQPDITSDDSGDGREPSLDTSTAAEVMLSLRNCSDADTTAHHNCRHDARFKRTGMLAVSFKCPLSDCDETHQYLEGLQYHSRQSTRDQRMQCSANVEPVAMESALSGLFFDAASAKYLAETRQGYCTNLRQSGAEVPATQSTL